MANHNNHGATALNNDVELFRLVFLKRIFPSNHNTILIILGYHMKMTIFSVILTTKSFLPRSWIYWRGLGLIYFIGTVIVWSFPFPPINEFFRQTKIDL